MEPIESLLMYDDGILHSWKDPQSEAIWVMLVSNSNSNCKFKV